MKPVLFQLPTPFGTFPISSFGVFLLLAFIVAITLTRARTRRLGWDPGEVVDLALYAIIGGIIGARIGYVLVNARDFALAPLRALMIWVDAGLTFYGALLGGGLVAWLYGRRRGWGLGQIADAAAPVEDDHFRARGGDQVAENGQLGAAVMEWGQRIGGASCGDRHSVCLLALARLV